MRQLPKLLFFKVDIDWKRNSGRPLPDEDPPRSRSPDLYRDGVGVTNILNWCGDGAKFQQISESGWERDGVIKKCPFGKKGRVW